MEIRIYNRELDLQGIIENQTSLIWNRKYNEVGDFELHVPITDNNRKLLKLQNLVYMSGADEAGVIEYVVMEESIEKDEITCKGRFLSSYMDRRITKATKTYTGKVERIMREMLSVDTVPIPRVVLGETKGFEEEVTFQCTYKGLLAYEQKLAQSANLGFRFRPDFNNKQIVFEIYKGSDRTMSQGVNNRVMFSEMYENLNKAIYTLNDQSYKTKIYVGGNGEGSERTIVTVGGGEGLDLREYFHSASDISQDGLSQAEYLAALRQRGNEQLEENSLFESMECETEPEINFVYRVNYDLGDVVTVKKKSWNITQDLRITGITEVYEYGSMTVVPTLGNPLPSTINWEDK
ncbi:MAG: siphovirus ReqiPepy6 Gp37-like family protein [Prevotellaceae bacterium]|nr:siphovirus ReqiPepy6 Gp37-like family protein [Prevotellaceae bacterium]